MTLRDDYLEGALEQAVPDRVPVRKTLYIEVLWALCLLNDKGGYGGRL